MGFRLVPKSVTLNDLERRNSPHFCVISPNSVAFRPDYVKVVGDTSILSAENCRPKNPVFFVIYHLRRYWQGITPSESIKVYEALPSRQLKLNHNLETVQDRR